MTDPLTTDPLTSDPLTSDPAASDPLTSDPVASDPLRSDPGVTHNLSSPGAPAGKTSGKPAETPPAPGGTAPPASEHWVALLPMVGTYSLGIFNDNFFKQAVLFLAIAAGHSWVESLATVMFAAPFILCSAWAGWLADRFTKSRLMLCSKILEVTASLIGAASLCLLSFPGMVLMIFLMAVQSTLFSPAINGSIPENFSPRAVPTANAALKTSTTICLLLGISLAGMILDLKGQVDLAGHSIRLGLAGVAGVILLAALLGLAGALLLRKVPPPPSSGAPFPWLGVLDSLRHAREFYRDGRRLFLALLAEAFFYFMGTLTVLLINNLGLVQYGFSQTRTSYLSVGVMAGICLGSLVASRIQARNWERWLIPSGLLMGGSLLAIGLAGWLPVWAQFHALLGILALTGLGAGVYLIPTVSFIQLRPAANARGKTLGVSNFLSYVGVACSGIFFLVFKLPAPSLALALCGAISIVFLVCVRLGMKNARN